ncbi:hypothetical protein MRX96_000801 [Rhipicephalus microplus]
MLVANFKKRSVIQRNPRDATLSASHSEVVDATTEDLATASVFTETVQSPSATEPSSSGRVRLDTIYRQISDLEEERAKAEDKFCRPLQRRSGNAHSRLTVPTKELSRLMEPRSQLKI